MLKCVGSGLATIKDEMTASSDSYAGLQSMGLGDDFLSGLFDSSTFASMAGARKVKGSSILSLGQVRR